MSRSASSMKRYRLWRVAAAMALAIAVGTPFAAHADSCRDRNFVDRLDLTLSVDKMLVNILGKIASSSSVRVTSSDYKSYDKIENTAFEARIGVDLCYPGALDGVEIRFGECTGHRGGCLHAPQMYIELPSARDFHKTRHFSFTIPTDSDVGKTILGMCNAKIEEARTADGDVPAGFAHVRATLAVDTRRDHGKIGNTWDIQEGGHSDSSLDEYSKTRSFDVFLPIACESQIPVAEAKAPAKITEAALGVATSGETCPKPATADVIIAAEAPRDVFYKIERGNGSTTTAGWIEGRIRKQKGPTGGESFFLRAEHKLPALDPGNRRFRLWIDGWGRTPWREIKVDCPPFKVTSAWLKYGVEDKPTCPKEVDEDATFRATRPGEAPFEIRTQGGLVVHSGTAEFKRKGDAYVAEVRRNLVMNAFDQDMIAEITNQPDANSGWTRLKVECMEILSGTLDLREFQATRCEGEAAFSIRTNMPGGVPYRLDCTGGRSWSGIAPSRETGPNTYLGVGVHRFEVSNNEQVNCAIKTDKPLPIRILALKGNKYQCHKPSDASGTSDLAPPTRPVDPPLPRQTLTGDFSFVDNGGPRCPRQGRALINFVTSEKTNVHYSLDCTHGSFSGVAQPAPGPKGGFVAPALVSFDIKQTTKTSCALKTVAPGNPRVHTLKGHLFQCVTPTGVQGAGDLAPPSRPGSSAPSGPGKAVIDPPRPTSPPRISCAGGRISGGRCVCGSGLRVAASGPNAFRCIRVVAPREKQPPKLVISPSAINPQIACRGGNVRNGKCYCPSGLSLKNGACTPPANVPARTGGAKKVKAR